MASDASWLAVGFDKEGLRASNVLNCTKEIPGLAAPQMHKPSTWQGSLRRSLKVARHVQFSALCTTAILSLGRPFLPLAASARRLSALVNQSGSGLAYDLEGLAQLLTAPSSIIIPDLDLVPLCQWPGPAAPVLQRDA